MKYSTKAFNQINKIMQNDYGVCYRVSDAAVVSWAAAKCDNPEVAVFSLNRKREKEGLHIFYI